MSFRTNPEEGDPTCRRLSLGLLADYAVSLKGSAVVRVGCMRRSSDIEPSVTEHADREFARNLGVV